MLETTPQPGQDHAEDLEVVYNGEQTKGEGEDKIDSARQFFGMDTPEDFDGDLDNPRIAEGNKILEENPSSDELIQIIIDLEQPEVIAKKALTKFLEHNPTLDDFEYILKNSENPEIKARVRGYIERLKKAN